MKIYLIEKLSKRTFMGLIKRIELKKYYSFVNDVEYNLSIVIFNLYFILKNKWNVIWILWINF